jgi:lipopolysaccharide export system protein LptC
MQEKSLHMSKWHIIAIILLIAILGTIVWQSPPAILRDITDAAIPEQQYPDAFFVNAKTIQYNEQGNLSHVVISDRANYFEPKASTPESYTLLTEPRFTFYDVGGNNSNNNEKTLTTKDPSQKIAWYASSKVAKSANNDEEILLSGNVSLIQQQDTDNTVPTTIHSEELLIKPNLQYAETNKPVIIKSASSVTTSTGLTLSLDTNTVELLSNVRSRYEPR